MTNMNWMCCLATCRSHASDLGATALQKAFAVGWGRNPAKDHGLSPSPALFVTFGDVRESMGIHFCLNAPLPLKGKKRLSFIGSATRLRKSSVAMRPVVQPRPLVTSETGNRGQERFVVFSKACRTTYDFSEVYDSRHFIMSSQWSVISNSKSMDRFKFQGKSTRNIKKPGIFPLFPVKKTGEGEVLSIFPDTNETTTRRDETQLGCGGRPLGSKRHGHAWRWKPAPPGNQPWLAGNPWKSARNGGISMGRSHEIHEKNGGWNDNSWKTVHAYQAWFSIAIFDYHRLTGCIWSSILIPRTVRRKLSHQNMPIPIPDIPASCCLSTDLCIWRHPPLPFLVSQPDQRISRLLRLQGCSGFQFPTFPHTHEVFVVRPFFAREAANTKAATNRNRCSTKMSWMTTLTLKPVAWNPWNPHVPNAFYFAGLLTWRLVVLEQHPLPHRWESDSEHHRRPQSTHQRLQIERYCCKRKAFSNSDFWRRNNPTVVTAGSTERKKWSHDCRVLQKSLKSCMK